MENRRIDFLTQLYKSISSFEFYRYFASQRAERAFLYLFLLTLFLGSLSLIRPIYDYNTGIGQLLKAYQSQVPDFELRDGQLDVRSDTPIIIDENNEPIIIDTTGKTDERVLDKYDNAMLVLRDRIVQKENGYVNSPVNFSDLQTLTITKESIENFVPFLRWINLFIVLFGLIWFYISKLFSIFLISLFALIICGISRFNVRYRTLLKLSFYAITLPIIIKIIVRLVGVNIPFFSLFYYALGALYVWLGAKAISNRGNDMLSEI